MAFAIAATATLLVYQSLLNLLRVPDRLALVLNVVATAVAMAAARRAGVRVPVVGDPGHELTAGLGTAAVIVALIVTVSRFGPSWPALRTLLGDRRAVGLGRADLAFHTLLRIPLATVALEEVAFRGVLLAAFDAVTPVTWAVMASSVAFGLWHVAPTLRGLDINRIIAPRRRTAAVTLAVVATTAAGSAFCLLRLATGGLVAVALVHWAINATSLVVAARAPGRAGETSSRRS